MTWEDRKGFGGTRLGGRPLKGSPGMSLLWALGEQQVAASSVGVAECGAGTLSERPNDSHSEPVSFPAPHSSSGRTTGCPVGATRKRFRKSASRKTWRAIVKVGDQLAYAKLHFMNFSLCNCSVFLQIYTYAYFADALLNLVHSSSYLWKQPCFSLPVSHRVAEDELKEMFPFAFCSVININKSNMSNKNKKLELLKERSHYFHSKLVVLTFIYFILFIRCLVVAFFWVGVDHRSDLFPLSMLCFSHQCAHV